ncbi:MAG: bifunctional phosphoribosylaminoimidazolecarboxamide formyltransferase/IMP cyclohydrolase [Bacteroidales bacterium]|nr:bifunctional phosphoribosylaminoimidazolecarboxamide formyltransferase/IMP cyclohydrolase [Bacteroidales bacterium]
MKDIRKIKSALISVYHKDNLENLVKKLDNLGVEIFSTGGTQEYIESLGVKVKAVEDLTGYPSILGGRVKTLHPKVFGGILGRRNNKGDLSQLSEYEIPQIDLVIVDLYPFEKTLASGASNEEIIEKIDIGGISLIRAAAKNFNDVLIVSEQSQYQKLAEILDEHNGSTCLETRKSFAAHAFHISSTYDTAIYGYFAGEEPKVFKKSISGLNTLRYGENPHQKGYFYGNFNEVFEKIQGKEISYNNLLDIEAAILLMSEFEEPGFAILKHNNACGIALNNNLVNAWKNALAADPISAFGGIVITNRNLTKEVSEEVDKLFFEVIIAPSYDPEAIEVLEKKKNRIILVLKENDFCKIQFRTMLNGVLVQERDNKAERIEDLKTATEKAPNADQINDLLFAARIAKHTKSNTIVLVKDKVMLASGVGQTSRVDALRQAIDKARGFGFSLNNSVMASDAFFPFADSVEIAHNAGINAVIQPGGSIKDQDSIDFCNKNGMSMVFTGVRHFKH